jgi:GDP-L-fucose synthase
MEGMLLDKNAKILVLGSGGMVGSAIYRTLQERGYTNILTPKRFQLDLLNGGNVVEYFDYHKPEYVFLAAAKVGGIVANSNQPVEFGRDNIMIQTNVLDAASKGSRNGWLKKLLFLGSSCIYPRDCPQPIKEEYLLTGPLEETNHMYALAKIHGIKMCQAYKKEYGCNFISCMPTNLYGINDNFDLRTSHVLPAIIRKMHDAKTGVVKHPVFWGDGSARREFLYVDDMAEACLFLMTDYNGDKPVNVGCGTDMTIKETVETIQKIVGYDGDVEWDTTKPNGTPRKVLDTTLINSIGWKPKTSFIDGVNITYKWYADKVK